ncbi:MAG TPA: shikimate dehydrogenase [Chloroflexota bacterium]|nr:shikimate dehydrogenase [Chloroflexota bacterium]
MVNRDLLRISGTTKALAIFGHPVSHSLSPVIHNAAFSAAGLDYCYLALDVFPEDIAKAVDGVKAMHFAGFTLTAPHKQTVIPLLDELTPEAQAIGAVNTVVEKDGRWIGTNTDATGFRHQLQLAGMYRKGMKALMLGSGGAARAVLYILSQVASEVIIFNRTLSKAEQLMESLAPFQGNCKWSALPLEKATIGPHLEDASLLVNTTSVGMHPDEASCPLPEGLALRSSCGVADLIYSPPKTRLIQMAEAAGAKAASGFDMLLYQGVDAFTFWTGVEPDFEAMKAALQKARS